MLLRPGRIGRRLALCTTVVVAAFGATAASASALPNYQVNLPTGPPKGVVLLIHGGGWVYGGPTQLQTLAPQVSQFLADGWETVNTDYSPLAGSLPDVLAVFDTIRQQVGPSRPICLYGQSAGANLALLVAEARSVSCVIDAAGPTDLPPLEQLAANYFIAQLKAAGVSDTAWSPARQAAQKLTAPTLAEYANYDWLVPLSQGQELRQSDPAHVTLLTLDPGSEMFVHSPVNPAELGLVHGQENALLAWVAAHPAPTTTATTTATATACRAKKTSQKTRPKSRHHAKPRRASHRKHKTRSVPHKAAC
jgi:pimeloyl-ACP methyl ester carboxylesterase